MSGLKRTLQTRTLEEKYFAIKVIEEGKKSKTQLAKDIGIPLNTLSTWLNPRNAKNIIDKYEKGVFTPKARRMRMSKSADVEAALLKWLSHMCASSIPLNGPEIQAKAIDLAAELGYSNFRCDHTWVMRFCRRHAIPYGRSGGDDSNACVEQVGEWYKNAMLHIPQDCESEDILNSNGSFFRVLPEQALLPTGDICDASRKSNDEVTRAAANMLPLLISGRSKTSRGSYKKQVKMTSADGESDQHVCLKKHHRKFHLQRQKMLRTNHSSKDHSHTSDIMNLKHAFLQANTTGQTQPVDESIVSALNIYYRKAILDMHLKAAEASEAATINVLQALEYLAEAWRTTSSETDSPRLPFASHRNDEKSINEENDDSVNNEHNEDGTPLSSATSRVAVNGQGCGEDVDIKRVIHTDSDFAATVSEEEFLSSAKEDVSDTEDDTMSPTSPKPSISQEEALTCLEKVKLFLQSKANTKKQLNKILSVQNDIKTMSY